MKNFIFFAVFCFVFGQMAFAQEQTYSIEGDHTLTVFDPSTQTYTVAPLDDQNLLAAPPHGGGRPVPSPCRRGRHDQPGNRRGPGHLRQAAAATGHQT